MALETLNGIGFKSNEIAATLILHELKKVLNHDDSFISLLCAYLNKGKGIIGK